MPEVRCAYEAGAGTPEGGGSKSPRGESPPRSQGMHPGNREKRRMPEVRCRCEAWDDTPESGGKEMFAG